MNYTRYTLLPINERDKLKREYHLRISIVACALISFAILAGIASLFPSYIRAVRENSRESVNAVSLRGANNDNGVAGDINELNNDQILVTILNEKTNDYLLSKVIAEIVRIRGMISLTSFSLKREEGQTIAVTLQGIAPTRVALLLFKSKLENFILGNAKVDLPINQLTHSTDIKFYLRLAVKINEK